MKGIQIIDRRRRTHDPGFGPESNLLESGGVNQGDLLKLEEYEFCKAQSFGRTVQQRFLSYRRLSQIRKWSL